MDTNLERWRYFLKDMESPELFIDWGFYSMIATALQRRVWLYPDTFTLYPNLFVILIGPPAAGKSRIISQINEFIRNPKLIRKIPAKKKNKVEIQPFYPLSADTITQEALIQYIVRECGRDFFYQSEGKRVRASHFSVGFMIEELGVLLRKNCENIVNMLNQLYDSRDFTYKTKHQGTDAIKNVCVNIVAGTTPSFIRSAFNAEIISQGFTSRVIMVYGDGPRFLRQFPGVTDEQKAAKAKVVEHLANLQNVNGPVTLSDECEAFHKEVYESGQLTQQRVNMDHRLDTYYGRKNVHLLKLSMIMHFMDTTDSMTVEKISMERALRFLAHTEIRMHAAYVTGGRNSLAGIQRRVRAHIINNSKAVPYKRLWLTFVDDLTKDDLDQCIEFLLATDQIKKDASGFKALVEQPTNVSDYL